MNRATTPVGEASLSSASGRTRLFRLLIALATTLGALPLCEVGLRLSGLAYRPQMPFTRPHLETRSVDEPSVGRFLQEEVLEPGGHAQWVFTIPKMLRIHFLHHRELLGELCRAAYETVHELMQAAAGDEVRVRPGMVAVIQTFRTDRGWSPHVHALVSRGAWDAQGQWIPMPHVDPHAAELIFRAKVLRFLLRAGRIDERRVELQLSWNHNTGFSLDNSVTIDPDDHDALQRLARYFMRAPVSDARLTRSTLSPAS